MDVRDLVLSGTVRPWDIAQTQRLCVEDCGAALAVWKPVKDTTRNLVSNEVGSKQEVRVTKQQLVDYFDGDVRLEGMLVQPTEEPNGAGILVAHTWAGRDQFSLGVAQRMAKKGYSVLAVDMYGGGRTGSTDQEKMSLMTSLLQERGSMARRMSLGFEALAAVEGVSRSRIGAMGFCFGGLCVQDLARFSSHLSAAVSFHGLLTPHPEVLEGPIHASLLILDGAQDPLVSPADRESFAAEMQRRQADCTFVSYAQGVHAFTAPEAQDRASGMAYDPVISKRAFWMSDGFLKERLG